MKTSTPVRLPRKSFDFSCDESESNNEGLIFVKKYLNKVFLALNYIINLIDNFSIKMIVKVWYILSMYNVRC